MSQILVFNLGSTSLKYKLFSLNKGKLVLIKKNEFENLGENKKISHDKAIKMALQEIGDLTDIIAIGHRVVHGGNEFVEPAIITFNTLKRLEKYNYLAPLHNPYNLAGIKATLTYFPTVPNIAVFDTAFFKHLPLKTKIYPIPFEFYKNFGIEKFGFHGISHQYTAQKAAKYLKKPLNKLKLITCHLGSGCSITAINKGKPIDTSMGFTPLEGITMMTRSGDIDPGIIIDIQRKMAESKDYKDITEIINKTNQILNFESGIKGICGIDNYLQLLKEKDKNPRAKLAFEIFIYRIQKYISAYWGILNKADAIVFTGKIGEGKPITRRKIRQGLNFLKKAKFLTIKTDEELAIAQECLSILKK
ncbi:acetate/propionate family kinase [bacterium]|nr:acetate/propionate family kinase [bacterium]